MKVSKTNREYKSVTLDSLKNPDINSNTNLFKEELAKQLFEDVKGRKGESANVETILKKPNTREHPQRT